MNKIFKFPLLIVSAAYLLVACSEKENSSSTESASVLKAEFFVRGNCGMCEERIENTSKKVDGVSEADYNVESKILTVSYDSTKTNPLNIHKAVAAVGHETKEVSMDDKAHEALPECCKKGFAH